MAQSRFDTCGDRFCATHGPEVHEKQARLLCKHVVVQRCDRNVVFFECRDHRINFLCRQHKIPCCRNFARAGFLEIDRLGYALRRSQCHFVIADRTSAGNSEGEHPSRKAAFRAQRILDCLYKRRRLRSWCRRCWLIERRL